MRPAGFLLTRQKSEVYTVRVGVFEFARKKPVLCPDISFSPRNSEMNGVRKNTKCEGIIIATPLPTVISSNFVSCIRCWGRSRRNHFFLQDAITKLSVLITIVFKQPVKVAMKSQVASALPILLSISSVTFGM